MIPIYLPLLGLVAIALWTGAVSVPRAEAARARARPLVGLERAVAALRQDRAPEAGRAAAGQAEALRRALPHGAAGIGPVIGDLRLGAEAQGWSVAWRPSPPAPPAGTPLGWATGGATFRPAEATSRPWAGLLGLLDTLSAPEARIDVTQMAIRADEQGRYSVETRLSIAYLAENQDHAQ